MICAASICEIAYSEKWPVFHSWSKQNRCSDALDNENPEMKSRPFHFLKSEKQFSRAVCVPMVQ